MTISIAEWRYQSRITLAEVSETAEIEVNAVLCAVLNKKLPWCLVNSNLKLNPDQIELLNGYLQSLLDGIPLAYILGKIEFFGFQFLINQNVLIPRPETELMVETAVDWLQQQENGDKVADVGCGSGVIIISILNNFPDKYGFGFDISRPALEIAKKNKELHHIKHLDFVQTDCLSGVQSKFDLIVANLPYIPTGNLQDLRVFKNEPEIALNGGKDGLAVINHLIEQLPTHLNKPGMVLFEIQFDQTIEVVRRIQNFFPEAIISIIKDYSNLDRIIKVEV